MPVSPAGGKNGKQSPGQSPRHPLGTDAEGILQELTTRQHLAPTRPLREVVAETIATTGVCPVAADRALAWLNLSGDRSVGRLKRGELIQLARSMYRFWTETNPPSTNPSAAPAGSESASESGTESGSESAVASFSPDAR